MMPTCTQELVLIASDAYMLADMDDAALAQQLPQGGRLAPDTPTTLRNTCLALLSAAMQWPDFRCRAAVAAPFCWKELFPALQVLR